MSETALALQDMRARAVLCDDALTIHAVVNSLFTVNESNNVSALEAQVLKGACSQSHSQCSRPLALPEARAALAYLRSVSSAWFLVEDAQHSKDVRIFKLIDANEARSVFEILREERRLLERAIHEYEFGKVGVGDDRTDANKNQSRSSDWPMLAIPVGHRTREFEARQVTRQSNNAPARLSLVERNIGTGGC